MKTLALTAHFDGENVQFDEPCQLEANARLMVVVLPPDDERLTWSRFMLPPDSRRRRSSDWDFSRCSRTRPASEESARYHPHASFGCRPICAAIPVRLNQRWRKHN